jgi:NhaC family Na+:H+ antiporter
MIIKMTKTPGLLQSFVPILLLTVLLGLNVTYFDDTLGGSNQIALLLSAMCASLIAIYNGKKWKDLKDSFLKTINSAMSSMIILLLIGSLAGTWMLSGVVPIMIYYGLDILHPTIFLFAAVIISAIVSLFTGSSWSTIATIGIALLGIGKAIGINPSVVAGAIISGAYFGDKMSPLSDTTNLAPAMAGTDIFTHIRYMMYTTIPSLILTLIIFIIWGFTIKTGGNGQDTVAVQEAIKATYNLNPLLLLVPGVLIFLIIKKVPPIPAMIGGILLGGIFAIIFQPDIIRNFADIKSNYLKASYITVMQAMFGDVNIETGIPHINDLLSTGGMKGMLDTVWLILSAMIFGGIMEAAGFLHRITMLLLKKVRSTGSLVASTATTCLFFNTTACDQYLSIVVPGRMFKEAYDDLDLAPEVLSRTLEDTGTVTSVLIPWNTCGATQSRILGVSTFDYLPYCFFNIISPFMSIFIAYINFKIRKKSDISE